MSEKEEKLSLEHQGDHHLAKVSLDTQTKDISAGIINNFSDHAAASFQIINGKVEGEMVHSGDTHSLRLGAKGDGSFEGTYTDSRNGGLEIAFKGGIASLVKGKLPEGGITVNGDHHKVALQSDVNGKISGVIESQAVKGGTFRIKLDTGKLNGSFVHAGDSHETEISLSRDGWKASVSFGKGNAKFGFRDKMGTKMGTGLLCRKHPPI